MLLIIIIVETWAVPDGEEYDKTRTDSLSITSSIPALLLIHQIFNRGNA